MNDERFLIGYKQPAPSLWLDGQVRTLDQPAQAPAATPPEPPKQIEVCRSFSYKMNLGKFGREYESADFFCSRKIMCHEEDAKWVSQSIFEECVDEIRESMQSFADSLRNPRVKRPSTEVARTA